MKQKLLELMPELDWIEDGDLRTKTLAVWQDAMERGGWHPNDLATIPFTLLIDPCPADFLEHTRGVTRCAVALGDQLVETYGDRLPIHRDVLVSGGLLHDIGKLLEYERRDGKVVKSHFGALVRHPFSGVGLAMEHGLPAEVVHVIAMHAKEGNLGQRSIEGILIHHADFSNFEPLKLRFA